MPASTLFNIGHFHRFGKIYLSKRGQNIYEQWKALVRKSTWKTGLSL